MKRIFLIIVFISAFYFPEKVLFSQSSPEYYMQPGSFGSRDVEFWFDRADSETDRDVWLDRAFSGLESYSESDRESFLTTMKERISMWQWRKIENQINLPDVYTLLDEIENKNYQYLYISDNGKINLDSNGKPLFKGLENLGSDSASWESELKDFIDIFLNEWEANASVNYEEILNLENGIDSDEKTILNARFDQYRKRIRNEFKYLYLAGRKNFITRRSTDQFSMKKESEIRSAGNEAEKRIEEVNLSLEEASETLRRGLDVLKSFPDGEIGVKVNEWEDNFREEFERGLGKWGKAEKSFLTERIRWEKEAEEGYIEAEISWDKAVIDFTDARSAWASEMKSIIEEGRRYWEEREMSFFESFKTASESIEEASLQEKNRFEKELTGYLSVYRESRNIEITADENIGYLRAEIKRIENYKKEKKRSVDRYQREIDDTEKIIKKMFALSGHSLFGSMFLKKARETELILPELYRKYNRAAAVECAKDDELSSYCTELAFWENAKINYEKARCSAEEALLSLSDTVKNGQPGSNEFDCELNILKEKRDILLRKLEIAEHVYVYSLDRTSERERASETEKKYKEALLLFKESETSYHEKIDKMENFIKNILTGSEIILEEKKKELLEAENILESVRCDYESAMEIFRLKDSSLIETSISNLEDGIDYYMDSELERGWEEYFIHIESLLRNEKIREGDELLSDILGETEDDNHTDMAVFEKSCGFLDSLAVDFNDPDIEDLINKFILEGFNTDEGFVKKYINSLNEGDKDRGEFYFNLIKAESRGELEKVKKGVEILSLEEIGKSPDEIILELSDLLKGKREALFGSIYEEDCIFSYLKSIPFEEISFDTQSPVFFEKIEEIALLEGEINALIIYSPFASAFAPFEREALYQTLSELFCFSGIEDNRIAGFTSFFEKRSDLIDFYERLNSLEDVPVYVNEIVDKVLEELIRDKGFVFDDDLDLPLIEDGIDPDADLLNNLKSCYEASLLNEYSEEEKWIYKALLIKALDILKGEADIITSGDIVKQKRSSILSKEDENRWRKENIISLNEKLFQWENEQDEYFNKNIADRKELLENEKDRIFQLRIEYHDLLNHFTSLVDQYRIKKRETEEALSEFNESKWNLYEAEELKDFAHSPYKLENTDPEDILEVRKSEFKRIDSLYQELINIKETVSRQSTENRFDASYLKIISDKKELISRVNYLNESSDKLARNIARMQEEAAKYYSILKDSLFSVFSYKLSFKPDIDNIPDEITDFTNLADENEIKNAVSRYFSGENSDKTFSNDTLRWLKSVFDMDSSGGKSLLRKFGIAFYAEYRSKVDVPIFSDQNYKKLKDYDYARYDPVHDTIRYADNVLSGIETDSELNRLYSFFKAMHLTGNTTLDPSFMGKDISKIAHDYMWDRCKSREHHIKKKHWWSNFWKKTAKKMRRMRHNMTDVNGNEERSIVFNDIAKAFSSRESFLDKRADIKLLTGGEWGKSVSFDNFLNSLRSVSGDLPEEAGSGFEFLLKNIYDSSGEEEKVSSYTLSSKILENLNEKLSLKNDELSLISENLEREREALISDYRLSLENGEKGTDELGNLFISLFYNPSYSRKESAEYSLQKILSSYSDDLKGRERTLAFAGGELIKLFSSSLDIKTDESRMKMKNQYNELLDKKSLFERRIAELYDTGINEWSKGFSFLFSRRKKWRDDYREEACLKEELWRDKYNIFRENRNSWVDESSLSAFRGESLRLSRELGINADKLLSESESIIIPDMKNSPDLDDIVEKVTASEKLSSLVSSARYYSSKKETDNFSVLSYLPSIGNLGGNDISLESFAENLSGEIRKRAALLEALKMAKTVTELEDGILANIESANRSTDKSISDTLEGKGYTRKGDLFSRKAVIDMTLTGGIEEELHEIDAYNYFETPAFHPGVDLSSDLLSSMSQREIHLKVEKAASNLRKYSDLIFGKRTSANVSGWKGFDEKFEKYLRSMEKGFSSSSQAGKYKDTRGLFYMHLGYAPVMEMKKPEKVKTEGYGEYGRIYKLYLRNEARLGRGLASFDVPWYSQKLWDDDKDNDGESDGLLGAPSVRSVGSIAMAAASGGAGAWALAVNMLDDAVFTAMDIGSGITGWDKGLTNLGKQAGISTAGILGGRYFDRLETESFFSSSAAAGMKTGTLNLVSTAVNSFDFNSDGLYFNTNSFGRNWQNDLYGKGSVSAYINSMTAAGLDSALTGFYGEDLAYGKAFSSTAAGAAAGIFEYNVLGSTKLNILNTSDLLFGSDKLKSMYGNTGLLELGIGGGGSLFDFGTEGLDTGISNIASSYKGINTYYQSSRISLSQKNNIHEARIGMRALYSAGGKDGRASELYENLLSGKDTLELVASRGVFDSIKKSIPCEKSAETVVNGNGGRSLRIISPGKGRMGQLHLGVMLAHEAHRDGYDNGMSGQNSETLRSVLAHTVMALDMENDYKGIVSSDPGLTSDAAALLHAASLEDMEKFSGYVNDNYDSSSDYWKLIKHTDGSYTMIDDGSDNLTVLDEKTGTEELYLYEGGSKTGFIAGTTGLSRDDVNQQMGPGAGWSYIEGKWENRLENTDVSFTPEQMERMDIYLNRGTGNLNSSNEIGILTKMSENISSAFSTGREWVTEKFGVIKSMIGINRYPVNYTVSKPEDDFYYRERSISPSDMIDMGEVSQGAHTENTNYLANWYTKGHPAVDITGKGQVSFPYDLELLKTGKNRNRLLYQIAGKNDYLYFSHIDSSDADALQKLLDKSSSDRLFYKAGNPLFGFPSELDKYSTDLHIHVEMYRKHGDGSYGFANPMTGDFLPEFEYRHSINGLNYDKWKMKFPWKKSYWN